MSQIRKRNLGRIIGLEEISVGAYKPDFFESILIKSEPKKKKSSYQDEDYYKDRINEIRKPSICFSYDSQGQDEVFDNIDEGPNPDGILPFIYEQNADNSFNVYTYKESVREIKYKVQNDRIIDFFYDSSEPYMKISKDVTNKGLNLQYALFSQDDGHPFKEMNDQKSQPYAKEVNKVSIFYQPTQLFRSLVAQRYIQKARDKVFALCAFQQIPIAIKITGAKIEPEYFINVWKSPFIRYPELTRIISNFNFYYSSYDSLNEEVEETKIKKQTNKIALKYISLPNIEQKLSSISNGKIIQINLPLVVIQKTVPTYPKYDEWESLPQNSFLPVYYRFSQIIEGIQSQYDFKIKTRETAYDETVNVISFLELGYTPMNTYLPEMTTEIRIDTSKNFLSYLNREKNVSSIMEIASKISESLFLPLEPGGVQVLVGTSKLLHVAYYTRNKNSVMANANAIAAGLRTSNCVIIPVTPSHVVHFLESLDCAFMNWKRFGLAKYNIKYSQPNTSSEVPKTTVIIYFEPGQRPFDAEIATKNIQYHCAKYSDLLDIKFAYNLDMIKKSIDIKSNEDKYKIVKMELLLSIAAFGTVNDCADYLELDDSYETKSSFAFQEE